MKMAHRPIPPNDVEYYIDKTRERASQSGRELNKAKEMRKDLVDDTYAEIERIKAQKMLEEVKRGVINNTGQNPILTALFQGKSPEQINEMLEKMTPQAVERLYMLASRMDNSNLVSTAMQSQQQVAPQKSEAQIMLDTIRLMKEFQPQGNSAKEIVEALTAGIKLGNDSRPPPAPVQQAPQVNPVELIKLGADLQRPGIDAVNAKDRQILDLKLKEIENKMPQDPIETLKYVKEMAGTLGLSNGAKSEIDLRLAEMKQNETLEMAKIDWEKEKWKSDAENELSKYEFLGKILEGPVGKAIQSIGNAGAERVRPHGSPNTMPRPVQTQCPNCQKVIYVDADAATAICGNCGAQLQKSGEAPQQPAQPETTRVADKAPAAPVPDTVDEKEEGEEETGELRSDETEPEQQ